MILDFHQHTVTTIINQLKQMKLDDWQKEILLFLEAWQSKQAHFSIPTSGSTSKAKIIQISKASMVMSAKSTIDFFELSPSNTALLCLPVKYIAGKMMLVRAIQAQMILYCSAPKAELELPNNTYDFAALTPMQAMSSFHQIHQIKTLILGGAPISEALLKKIKSLAHTHVYETYGMTETITHIALKQIHPKKSSCFTTLPNITVGIDDRGCLVINAPRISNHQIITNDVVNMLSNNSFEWIGRQDYIINSGGVKLNPELIEQKLSKVIQLPFFVAGLSDDLLGQKLILVVESQNKQNWLQIIQSKDLILNKIEIPKEVFVLSEFVRTKTNKINRNETLKLISSFSSH